MMDSTDCKSSSASQLQDDCRSCPKRDDNPICSVNEVLSQIQNERTVSRFRAGHTIFFQGNTPLGLYVIKQGLVKLENVSANGSNHTLRLVGPGQPLGYRALLATETYNANAIAVDDVTTCFFPRNVVLSTIEKFAIVGVNLLKQLAEDLRLAEDKWITQVDRDAGSRVAEALIFLNDHFQGQPWTRREIAQWAGTTPETVMRVLAQFEKQGWVQAKGRHYSLLSRENLIEKARGT